jgi:hypothetical protein
VSDKTLQVQIYVELPEAEARALLAEIRDHAARDATDGHRDSGLVMVLSEAIFEVGLLDPDITIHHPGDDVIEVWTR